MTAPQVGALEAVTSAQRPSATLQALAEALGALGAANTAAAEGAGPGVDAAQAEIATLPEAVLPSGSALAAQGRLTLGQLAAEQALRRAASNDVATAGNATSVAVPVLRHDVAPEGVNTPRLPDVLAVPVMVSALHAPPVTAPRPQKAGAAPRRVSRDGECEADDHAASEEPVPDTDTARHGADTSADEAPADPEALRLCAALAAAGRNDALAELDRGRRLLLVLPTAGAAPVPAVVWLLSARRAQRHGARWWPGLAGTEGWLPWRVFRDGDPQLGRGLVSRAAGPACRVRLGPQPPRLQDAGAASLEIAERIRFAQALGGQWSLLLLAAPAGWAA